MQANLYSQLNRWFSARLIVASVLALVWLAYPCSAQGTSPSPTWLSDPALVAVTTLPKVQNLPEVNSAATAPAKATGTVSFWVLVNEQGAPVEQVLIGSTGTVPVEAFAAEVAKLRFEPARKGGQAVTARTAVCFTWPAPAGDVGEPTLEDEIAYDQAAQALNHADLVRKLGYPAAARAAGQRGRLILRVLVDEHGRYANHVLKRTAGRLLLEAVEREIAQLAFSPAMLRGQAVKSWVDVAFDFGVSP